MPDKDNNFGGSLGLDFRKWSRHVQAKDMAAAHLELGYLGDWLSVLSKHAFT